jgi:NMD protein affecting ribosome stability and mRNA decay
MTAERTWTCDHCGFEFPHTRKTPGGVPPTRCTDCKQATRPRSPRLGAPRSNDELLYVLARECSDLRAAMQLALAALTVGRRQEALIALESVVGPPVWMHLSA